MRAIVRALSRVISRPWSVRKRSANCGHVVMCSSHISRDPNLRAPPPSAQLTCGRDSRDRPWRARVGCSAARVRHVLRVEIVAAAAARPTRAWRDRASRCLQAHPAQLANSRAGRWRVQGRGRVVVSDRPSWRGLSRLGVVPWAGVPRLIGARSAAGAWLCVSEAAECRLRRAATFDDAVSRSRVPVRDARHVVRKRAHGCASGTNSPRRQRLGYTTAHATRSVTDLMEPVLRLFCRRPSARKPAHKDLRFQRRVSRLGAPGARSVQTLPQVECMLGPQHTGAQHRPAGSTTTALGSDPHRHPLRALAAMPRCARTVRSPLTLNALHPCARRGTGFQWEALLEGLPPLPLSTVKMSTAPSYTFCMLQRP